MRQRFAENAQVTCTDNDKTVTADVMSYNPKRFANGF